MVSASPQKTAKNSRQKFGIWPPNPIFEPFFRDFSAVFFYSLGESGTEKVPQRTFAPKILPNFRELSGAICLKTLVLLGRALELFRKFFGTVPALFWLLGFSFGP